MRHYVTCSALSRIFRCLPSAVYPYTKGDGDGSKVGSAGHGVMEFRGNCEDRSKAFELSMAEIDPMAKKFALDPIDIAVLTKTMANFKYVPPAGSHTETSFAMDRDLNVTLIPKEKAQPGNYEVPAECAIAGTMDLAFMEGEVLFVPDYKFGQDRWVTPIDHNGQLWTLAYMAGQYFKAKYVMPAVIFIRPGHPDGVWELPDGGPFPMGSGRMLQFQIKLQDRIRKLDELRAKYAAGEDLAEHCVRGLYCQFCPAIAWCPSYLATARKLLGIENLQLPKKERRALEADEARAIAQNIGALDRAVRNAKELLVGYASENGPIDTGDGLHWGPVEETQDEIVTSRQMFEIMFKYFEDSSFDIFKCSKSAIYDACRDIALKQNKKITEINRLVIGDLRTENCIQQKKQIEHKLFRPDIEQVKPKKREG